ncbi:WD40/YVTN/BNR-like repeat-containing protein [Cumulibacter manganitolerans]|uniref:WD40/YVTN/BNR-like repeat-containing protein n=1 Tax=Cumulibacter manganitolerans TaxID=1884992 RepID=UPI001295C165|nr:hypothetical protein [Cumulibacter manganitolerans]
MKKNWAPIALAAFAVVDLVLVYLAFRHTSAPAAGAADPTTQATSSPATSGSASRSAGSSSSAAGSSAPGQQAPASALLSMASDGTVLRATAGACQGGNEAKIELSTDSGKSFNQVGDGAREVLRVIAKSQANLQYVGADESCAVSLYQSVDGGKTWSKGPADGSWYLKPGGKGLVAPGGNAGDVGCTPVALSVVSKQSAFVACSDGSVRSSSNGGAQWQQAGAPSGVVSVSFLDQSNGYALAVGQQCPAEVRRTNDGGATWTPVGCIQGSQPQALDAIGQRVFATVDGKAHMSSDGGATWS